MVTESPETVAPEGLVTVSVIVEVLTPVAAIEDGLATTALVLGTGVCVMVPPALNWFVAASVAVMAQGPVAVPAV
jgi:hypothetical protein